MRLRETKQTPEALDVVVHLRELVVHRGVGDRGEMENAVEFFVAKLRLPIERREVGRDKIAAIAAQVFEIARAKIVDHGQTRRGIFLLQRKGEVGADEAGPTGDEKVRSF